MTDGAANPHPAVRQDRRKIPSPVEPRSSRRRRLEVSSPQPILGEDERRTFVIPSICTELGLIIDRCGRVLKESTYETLAVSPIHTNRIALYQDTNQNKMDAMLAKYDKALTFDFHTREVYHIIDSAGDGDIDELVKEPALEPAVAYLDRSRNVRSEMLAKYDKSKSRADR